jgi:hypothetical protein
VQGVRGVPAAVSEFSKEVRSLPRYVSEIVRQSKANNLKQGNSRTYTINGNNYKVPVSEIKHYRRLVATGKGIKYGALGVTSPLWLPAVGAMALKRRFNERPRGTGVSRGGTGPNQNNNNNNSQKMNQNGLGKKTLNVLGRGAKLFGPTQNNNANRARQNALKQAITEYAKVFNGENHIAYIKTARKLNSVLAEPPKNNREYKNGLAVLRVTAGTTAANIRRKINERLRLNRTKFLKTALLNTAITQQNLKNVFGSNTNLSYRIFANRFNGNLVTANTLNKLRNLEAAIPAGHPSANKYKKKIANKRNNVSSKAPVVQPPNNKGNKGPNVKPSPNNKGNNRPKNNKGNRGAPSGGATASAVGIGSQIIQIGSGNSNLRRRLENLERARNASERAKANVKNTNAKAKANPGNANAARANANAARAALEAMKKELEALTAAKMAAEAEKAKLQSNLEAAQATGANVEALRKAYANAQNAATKMESNFKAKLTEATEEAEKARANANAAKANATAKETAAAKATATAAEHLEARKAAEKAASEASNAASAALVAKEASNTQYALAQVQIKAITANKNATNAEKSAAIANAAAARARMAEANARARNAEAARLSATSAATVAMRKAAANVAKIQKQLVNATEQAERNAANIARLTAQGATKAQVNAARANAARHAAEANRLRRELTTASAGGLVRSGTGLAYGAGSMLAAGLRRGTNALFGALPVQATVSLQRSAPAISRNSARYANNARRRQAAAEARAQYSSSSLIRGENELKTNIAGSKFIQEPKINLKPYRNRYTQAMAYGNSALQLTALTQLQRNLRGFTPNNSTRNNKRILSENINTALRQLETLGERTQRYTAFATGTTRGPAPSQNVWKNVFGR